MTVPLRYAAHPVVEPALEPLPIVQLEHVESGTAKLVAPLTSSDTGAANRFLPGDVLFSKLRPYLAKSLLVTERLRGSGEFLCLRPQADTDARFLTYVTLGRPWLDHAMLTSYGTKMPRTSWEQMADLRIPLPAMEEQRRIADFLDDRVARIDRSVAARAAQRRLSAEAFAAFLEDRLWRNVATAPVKYLLFDVTSGPRGWGDLITDVGTPFVRIGNLSPLGIELRKHGLVNVDVPEDAESRRAALSPGDVLLSITAAFGEVGVWRDGVGTFSQHVARLRPRDKSDADWLAWVLQTHSAHDQYRLSAYGGTKIGMGLEQVRNLSVPYVASRARSEAVRDISAAWSKQESADSSLERSIGLLREYRQSLITAAVTGDLDVTTTGSGIPG